MADSTVTVSLGSGADTLATAGKIAVRRVVEGSKGDMLVLSDWREYTLGPDPLVLDDIEVGVMYESRELQPRGESRFWVAPATATPYADLDFVIPLPATPGILGDALIDGVLSNSASDAYATLEQFVIDHPGPTGPAGPGGSDSGVAGYIASSSSATSAALSAKNAADIATDGTDPADAVDARAQALIDVGVPPLVAAQVAALDLSGQITTALSDNPSVVSAAAALAGSDVGLVHKVDRGQSFAKTFENDEYARVWASFVNGVYIALMGVRRAGGWIHFPKGFDWAGARLRVVSTDQYAKATVSPATSTTPARVFEDALDRSGNVPVSILQRWGARLAAAGTAALAFWPFQPKPTTITKTVRQDGSGDFTTITAAIAAATDSSVVKRYRIDVGPGFYTESKLLRDANYVTVAGRDPGTVKVIGYCTPDATDTVVADTSTFDLRGTEVYIENITATIQNGRYVVHPELNGADVDAVKGWSNCRFEHLGNTEIDTWRAANPSQVGAGFDRVAAGGFSGGRIAVGEGTASGVVLTSRNTVFKGPSTYYLHDNIGFTKGASHKFVGDTFAGSSILIIESIGAGLVSLNEFDWCPIAAERFVLQDSGWKNSGVDQPASHYENRVVLRGCVPVGATFTSMQGRALKIESSSTGSVSTVAVSGTAATACMGLVRTRDGGGGLKGYAWGRKDISGMTTASGTALVNTIGKLLGDCSTVSKTLTVVVDGGAPINVVFNTDLTAASNTTILATINTALGSAATASVYAVDQGESYPRSDHEALLLNDGTVGIGRWNAVKWGGNRRSAQLFGTGDAVTAFAGVALEPIPPGAYGRVLRRGKTFASAGVDGQIPGITALASGDPVSLSTATAGSFTTGAGKQIGTASDTNILAFTGTN